MQRKFLGIIAVDFDGTGKLLIGHSAYVKYWRKKWEYNEAVHKLRKSMIHLGGRSCIILSLSLVSPCN